MPYLKEELRRRIDKEMYLPVMWTPGELNYVITRACQRYLKQHDVCYTAMNEVMGALECAKQEFYRRVVAPYESERAIENGDIYDE